MTTGVKDGKEKRLCINLNDAQYDVLKESSETLGVSMCQFIRMYLNTLVYAKKKLEDAIEKGDGQLANEKSLTKPNQLQ